MARNIRAICSNKSRLTNRWKRNPNASDDAGIVRASDAELGPVHPQEAQERGTGQRSLRTSALERSGPEGGVYDACRYGAGRERSRQQAGGGSRLDRKSGFERLKADKFRDKDSCCAVISYGAGIDCDERGPC